MKGAARSKEENRDLGFGSRVTQASAARFLNRDGSFTVRRRGLGGLSALSPYQSVLTTGWGGFFAVLFAGYLLFNVLFAAAYYACGEGAIRGAAPGDGVDRFLDGFFFSIHTSTTIGYGHMSPVGMACNILVSIEAIAGLMGFALATGLLFARFSRPEAHLVYSKQAVIAPYRGMTGLMFRIANSRRSELLESHVRVLLTRFERVDGKLVRRFHELTLERANVMFFPLHWTVVHPIDDNSPLSGVGEKEFMASTPELLVLFGALDDTFSQSVHSRTSYRGEEIVWGARFADMFHAEDDGSLSVDLRRIHDIERVPLQ